MICNQCASKSQPLMLSGICNMCQGATTCFSYKLCDDCSDEYGQCESCARGIDKNGDPLVAVDEDVVPDGAYFITLTEANDGQKQTGLRVGEYIKIILPEDQYSSKEWNLVTSYDRKVLNYIHRSEFIPTDEDDMQYGTRTFVFLVKAPGNTSLQFEEVTRVWTWFGRSKSSNASPVPGGQKVRFELDCI